MEKRVQSTDQVVGEIMRIHRSLPPRPGIEEVEAAKVLIQNVEKEEESKLEAITKQNKSPSVPDELFMVLQDMQKGLVHFFSKEQKREASKLLDVENLHSYFDDLIQRASNCVSFTSSSSTINKVYCNDSDSNLSKTSLAASVTETLLSHVPAVTNASSSLYLSEKQPAKTSNLFSKDDSHVKKAKSSVYSDKMTIQFKPQIVDATLKPRITSGQNGEKMSLIKLASLIEVSAKKGVRDLNLQNKLSDQIEWLPDSIGKLSSMIKLDLSENRTVALPETIGRLSALTELDLHSNRITQLPETISDLVNLIRLNLSANHLSSLPVTFGKLIRLEELDLSSNNFSILPESVGSLVSLNKLNIETNNIEEISHTIGHCSSLKELLAAYNRLKALPEAIGRISTLEILSVRYNNIRQLPTTMSTLSSLKEVDVSFNELESVPESLCFATTLVKLNIANNFADMRYLPRSIGNLEMLEELDVSNNQIRILPDSFGMLTRLRVFRAEENPLEVPPRQVAEMGAEAVVQYMNELVEKRDTKSQPVKQKKSWVQTCFFSRSNKRKHNGMEIV